MGRKPIHSAEEKLSVVMSVLKGEMTQVEIARRLGVSDGLCKRSVLTKDDDDCYDFWRWRERLQEGGC